MKMKLLVVLAFLAACGRSTEPERGPERFTLVSIGSEAMPWTFSDSLKIHNGHIELRQDSTFVDVLTYDYVFSGMKLTKTDTVGGEYHVTGSMIQFVNRAQGYYTSAGYNGSEITIVFDRVWRYTK